MHSHIHTPRHTQCQPKHQTHINADTILVACKSTASIHTHTYTQTQSVPTHTKYLFTLTLLCTLVYSQHVCMHSHMHISRLSLSHTPTHPYPHCVTHTHWVDWHTCTHTQTHLGHCEDWPPLHSSCTDALHSLHWCVPAGRCYQTYTHISHMLHTHTITHVIHTQTHISNPNLCSPAAKCVPVCAFNVYWNQWRNPSNNNML